MGLIRLIANDGVAPENAGDKQMVNGNDNIRTTVSSGVVSIQLGAISTTLDVLTLTYTATGPATIPSDADIYAAWEPVLVAAAGSACSIFDAPQLESSAGDAIYPAIAIG
jgi:hypothetical protein